MMERETAARKPEDVRTRPLPSRAAHGNLHPMSQAWPPPLAEIVSFFAGLDEAGRRENLVALAETVPSIAPRYDLHYQMADVRTDPECMDEVGVFFHVDDTGAAHFAMTLGPKVQTLTRALAVILCRGLSGASPRAVLDVDRGFVPLIIGETLVRMRSQTVYYVLNRMKQAVEKWLWQNSPPDSSAMKHQG
jgi:cysteine desulfuration protein SufE